MMSQPDHVPLGDNLLQPEAWVCAAAAQAVAPPLPTPTTVLSEAELARWEAALTARQARLEAAQVTLATVREDMRAQRQQIETTRRQLDERSQGLEHRARVLALRHQKLVSVATRIKEIKAQFAARLQTREQAPAADPRHAETHRQLQLIAFERNRLAHLVDDLKRERDFLERRVETLERQASERTEPRVVVARPAPTAFDRVPKYVPTVNTTPTRSYPVGWHTHNPKLSTKVRQGLENIWEYFTSPCDPTLPPIN